jgi:hypothetical protein
MCEYANVKMCECLARRSRSEGGCECFCVVMVSQPSRFLRDDG